MQRNIAIYGKGGIGKSTVSSHLSAFWGLKGHRVALIGCDPKRDTTLLLTGNKRVKPVLQALKENEDIRNCFVNGYANVLCSEIGGPEPGVGCAGRGLLLAFELIDRLGILRNTEIILYDVPGDVVCGGFVVPMKRGSEVYIVTSGEYLSLYAANNICKGAENAGSKVGGLILNSKFDLELERRIVEEFANAVGTEVVGVIPYLKRLKECEILGKTVFQLQGSEYEVSVFQEVAERILENKPSGKVGGLEDEELIAILEKFYSSSFSQTQNSQKE
ncbi:MAG: nitrogenase iron protein NifH [Archaeoglobaceae archaeon]|nr:nitrogenase iron protein NifH [Archaeoglobaceae archaeon]